MNGTPERRALQELRDALSGPATFEVHPLDIEEACQRYTEDGYEVTDQLREFLESYGELTMVLKFQNSEMELTTSVERTLESTHATPRNVRIFAKELGQPVSLVGTAFVTEEAVLLAENGDVLFVGDAGYQRIANGFENAVRALVTGNWDRTFF
ncbi:MULTISPECIES: SUKH-3 domain-containing protein [Streptomyces]|uniref:SUKH-3 domain-containing protein n=1 Tax=Streptomyces TaxID=1883 RepID=UPI001F2A94B5|nr:SUKH-3 domain-containing protein [Streptomyces sp. A1-5]UJB44812.1 SUKH-3 domain-containing protein [Streptomyces sp. A1-5]